MPYLNDLKKNNLGRYRLAIILYDLFVFLNRKRKHRFDRQQDILQLKFSIN